MTQRGKRLRQPVHSPLPNGSEIGTSTNGTATPSPLRCSSPCRLMRVDRPSLLGQLANWRISSPPVVSPCFYGIDFPDEDDLPAAHRSVEEMRQLIGATSLHYLSVEGMQAATQLPEDSVCRACFTRDYPTRVPPKAEKLRFEPATA